MLILNAVFLSVNFVSSCLCGRTCKGPLIRGHKGTKALRFTKISIFKLEFYIIPYDFA